VTSRTTKRFRAEFAALPREIQEQARRAYALWRSDPAHPSLQFKPVHANRAIFSARIGLHWRSVAIRREDGFVWFWIGSHADYDRLLGRL